ncbi:MAG: Lrp/AsnC family transcriptional regulator [Candidatus Bathyarchaeia archaeon]
MPELDETDRLILSELQTDARASFAAIAKKIGVSEGTVHLRVRKLVNDGVIKGFYTLLDAEKVGLGLKAIICLKADPARYEESLKRLSAIDEIAEIYDVTGEYYAVLKVKTKDRESLAAVIDAIGATPGITSTTTMIVLRSVKERFDVDIPP